MNTIVVDDVVKAMAKYICCEEAAIRWATNYLHFAKDGLIVATDCRIMVVAKRHPLFPMARPDGDILVSAIDVLKAEGTVLETDRSLAPKKFPAWRTMALACWKEEPDKHIITLGMKYQNIITRFLRACKPHAEQVTYTIGEFILRFTFESPEGREVRGLVMGVNLNNEGGTT